MAVIKLSVSARSHVGLVREGNEDNFDVLPSGQLKNWGPGDTSYTSTDDFSVFVIADGMGGTNSGEVASLIAVQSVRNYFDNNPAANPKTNECNTILTDSIIVAHNNIVAHAAKYPEFEGMGTTLVVCMIENGILHAGWSGDSRCYLFRDNVLKQVSKDHSYVQQLVDENLITASQAFYHPQSNIILQSLGDRERPPKPDYVQVALMPNDVILMNTDGLNGMIEDHRIGAILSNVAAEELNIIAERLIATANAEGGVDNTTLILVKVEALSGYIAKPSSPANDKPNIAPKADGSVGSTPPRGRGLWMLLVALLLVVGGVTFFLLFRQYKMNFGIEKADSSSSDFNSGKKVVPNDTSRSIPADAGKDHFKESKPSDNNKNNGRTNVDGKRGADTKGSNGVNNPEPGAHNNLAPAKVDTSKTQTPTDHGLGQPDHGAAGDGKETQVREGRGNTQPAGKAPKKDSSNTQKKSGRPG